MSIINTTPAYTPPRGTGDSETKSLPIPGSIMAEFFMGGSMEIEEDAGIPPITGRANFNSKTIISATAALVIPISGTIDFIGGTSIVGHGYVVGETSWRPEVDCEFDFDLIAGGELGVTILRPAFVDMQFGFGMDVNTEGAIPEEADRIERLRLGIDIVPPLDLLRKRAWLYELKVDGEIVDIENFVYSEPKGEVGSTLTFNLANINQIPDIHAGTSFDFRIGQKINDVITWRNLFTAGRLSSTKYNLSRPKNAPLTTFSFSNESNIRQRLKKSPNRTLIMYDPFRTEVDVEEFDPIFDVNGVEYLPEVYAFGGLKMYDIFAEVFSRLGFSGYRSNIKNSPVRRQDFPMTSSYLESLKSLIGIFDPLIFEYEDKIWIIDATNDLPAGFPPSLIIKVESLVGIEIPRAFEPVDGYLVTYSEDGRTFNYFTTRQTVNTDENGSYSLGTLVSIKTTSTVIEYRHTDRPQVVLKSEIKREIIETSNNSGFLIGRTSADFSYDYQGRLRSSVKKVEAMVPRLGFAGNPMQLQEISEVRQNVSYAQDPYKPSRQIQSSVATDEWTLLAINSANGQLGQPFKQPLIAAYEAGNLEASMTSAFELTKSTRVRVQPLRGGQVRIHTTVVDYLMKTTKRQDTDPEVGDYSLNGIVSKQRQIIVWAPGVDENTENPIVKTASGGELPVIDLIDLIERKIERNNDGDISVATEFIGTYFYIRRGLPFTLKGLDDETMINAIIEGYSISGDYNSLTTRVDGIKVVSS